MKRFRTFSGFSLVEVLIAVGVLAVSIAAVLALLPVVTRQIGEASDALVAHGLADAIEMELRERVRRDGFAAVSARFTSGEGQPGLRFVAAKSGERIQNVDTTTLPEEERYFLIELWRHSTLWSSREQGLPLRVRVAWPWRMRTSAGRTQESAPEQRATAEFTVSVTP